MLKVDEYSKTGPKSPKATRADRERELAAQMRGLLASKDEVTLKSILISKYDLNQGDPRFDAIMKIWRDAQQRLQHER